MLADIASLHSELSDWLLLVAAILFLVAAVLAWSARPLWTVASELGLVCVAVALLVL